MHNHIMYCPKCKLYTLEEKCPKCGAQTIRRIPPKFSFPDKYGKYRRELRKEILVKKGLL